MTSATNDTNCDPACKAWIKWATSGSTMKSAIEGNPCSDLFWSQIDPELGRLVAKCFERERLRSAYAREFDFDQRKCSAFSDPQQKLRWGATVYSLTRYSWERLKASLS